ncbi:MAG: hypothetical protein Q8P62_02725 [Candidatus Peregrinibacteria bacterium]|nr:hypothetical protein [Candidatus Peregrinibacteria bacterium]
MAGPELNTEAPRLSNNVALNFKYNFKDEKPEGFDVLRWNLYAACSSASRALGFKGRDIYLTSSTQSRAIMSALRNTKIKSPRSDKQVSALLYLRVLAAEKKIAKIVVKKNSSFSFLDKNGDEIFSFNERGANIEALLSDSVRRRRGIQESLLGFLSRKTKEFVRKTKKASKKIGIDFDRDDFQPSEKVPTLGVASLEQGFSPLDLMRTSGKAPDVIEDRFRKLAVCSSYATQLLIQEFGKTAVARAGLIKNGKFPNAWDIKENGLRAGGISVAASTVNSLRQRSDGRMEVSNKSGYVRNIGKIFENTDDGHYPSLITAFHFTTHYAKSVVAANMARDPEFRSYNSHVLVCIGREDPKFADVKSRGKLEKFIRSKTKIASKFHGFLNIKIYKKDGRVVDLAYKKTHGVTVEAGDRVSWQDVLVSDFFHRKERVLGLALYASSSIEIITEQLVLNGVKKATPKYEAADYFHFKPGASITVQLKERFNLDDTGVRYYLAALADAGIDTNRVSPKTIIPVFDIAKMKAGIDAKGGPEKVLASIRIDRARDYNESRTDGAFTVLEAGKTPWDHFGKHFESNFKGNHALTNEEKNYILKAVDWSCPTMDLASTPIRFQAGDSVFLSYKRIGEIISAVKEIQAKKFGKNDYVKIIKPGEYPYGFVQSSFDAEAAALGYKTLRYENLDGTDKGYLLRVLDVCSDDVDLGLTSDSKGRSLFKHFVEGARLILRKTDLKNAIKIIAEKQELQAAPESVALSSSKGKFDVNPDVKTAIDSVFGNDIVVRNCLYLVWLNEQARGGWRAFAKKTYVAVGGTARSVGEFQIRVTNQDLKACRGMFEKHGIKPPQNRDELVTLVRDNLTAATIVAGMRIKESATSFSHFMVRNGESPHLLDKNFTVMTVNSYNRSIDSVYKAVFQNWAYNLASQSGASGKVNLSNIDSLIKEPGARASAKKNIILTFKAVAEKLIAEGKIKFSGNVDREVSKILTNNIAFIEGDLFRQMKGWYESDSGKKLSFVFTNQELARGDGVFSYGQRFLKQEKAWGGLFKDHTALASSFDELGKEPVVAAFVPEIEHENIGAKMVAERKEELRKKLFRSCGIDRCLVDGNLTCQADGMPMYSRAGRGKESILPAYSKLRFVDLVQENGVLWAKVEKGGDGNKKKQVGYVMFNQDLFAPAEGNIATVW